MLKHFKSSPLWLIGLFIIFAQATAGVAAVQIEGWPQGALVVFVITYSTIVTGIFFAFLWFKPENFYAPSEYSDISPQSYAEALRGLPEETARALEQRGEHPSDRDASFQLMDNLLKEYVKQHLVLMRRHSNTLNIGELDEFGHSHRYEIITREKGGTMGWFSPREFFNQLKGTNLVTISGGGDKIFLTQEGKSFADWLVSHEKDAETFKSDLGEWGIDQSVMDIMKERLGEREPNQSLQPTAERGD